MPDNVIGKIPEFNSDKTPAENKGIEEVKQPTADEVVEKEKETPTEPPAETKPDDSKVVDGTGNVDSQLQGLMAEKAKLLDEIKSLRGQRREIKQEEVLVVQKQMDDLKDLYPDDIEKIDRILKHKGYMTAAEANKMFYKNVQDEELGKFLDKYPEYKQDNDPNDINWNSLQRVLSLYKMPENPRDIGDRLERAHRELQRSIPSDRTAEAKKRQIEVAGVGAKAAQRSSSIKSLDPDKRRALQDGGWSEEDIKAIEKNLN